MAIKKVIIHAGFAKTGTTSIQGTLFNNVDALKENGYCYLTNWLLGHNEAVASLFANAALLEYFRVGMPWIDKHLLYEDIKKKHIEIMMEEISKSNFETLIISSENIIHFLSNEEMQDMKSFFLERLGKVEFQGILYVREPLSWVESEYQTGMSYQHTPCDLKERLKSIKSSYSLRKISHFQNVFENTNIHKFEDAVKEPDGLIGHFLRDIGYPEDKIQDMHDVVKTNESACMEAVEFAEYVYDRAPPFITTPNGYTTAPHRVAGDLLPFVHTVKIRGPKFRFSSETRTALLHQAREEAEWLKLNTDIDYTDIDYTDAIVEKMENPILTYGEEAIDDFIKAFPLLTLSIKGFFLDFFKEKYLETNDSKFLRLFSADSLPFHIYQLETLREANMRSEDLQKENMRQAEIIDEMQNANNRHMETVANLQNGNDRKTATIVNLLSENKFHAETNAVLQNEINALAKDLAAVRNSTCWKMTAPLRKIMDVIKLRE